MAGMHGENVVFVEDHVVALLEFMSARLVQVIVHHGAKVRTVTLDDADPEVFAPTSGRHWREGDGPERSGLFVTENRICGLLIAFRARALLGGVRVDGEPRRIEAQFDELPRPDMGFEDGVRYLEPLSLLGMHGNTVDQFVAVGEPLLQELCFEIHGRARCKPEGGVESVATKGVTFDLTGVFGERAFCRSGVVTASRQDWNGKT